MRRPSARTAERSIGDDAGGARRARSIATRSKTCASSPWGPLVASTDEERAARQAHVQQTEADFDPLPFDTQAARSLGRVAASLRRAGRKTKARAYDAMIAAIALAHGLPVYTCNPDDFAGIDGLDVVSLPAPG